MADPASIFGKIYRERTWGSQESVSGAGSELQNTAQIIRELPPLLKRLGIKSMLDIPCGDFNWMQYCDLGEIHYIGADIVPDIIDNNRDVHGRDRREFVCVDLLKDPLPPAELILCRDCLFHFSHDDVFKAFDQIARSQAQYILTTTFTYRTWPRNANITTGSWTPINLEMPPYDLPPPQALIAEGNRELIIYGSGIDEVVPMYDRSLGLWSVDDIRSRISSL